MLFLLHVSTKWPEGLKGTSSIWHKSSSEMSWKTKRKCTCRAVWSPADLFLYHRWIKISFLHVVLITRIYELTGGIERNPLYLTAIIIGKFLKNKKEMHLQGSLVGDRLLSLQPLDHANFWICGAPRCFLHSERWRSETHSPARFRACWTVARAFSGKLGFMQI